MSHRTSQVTINLRVPLEAPPWFAAHVVAVMQTLQRLQEQLDTLQGLRGSRSIHYNEVLIDDDLARPLALQKSTVAVVAPGADVGLVRFERGTNSGTLKCVVYGGTSTTGVTVADNIGTGST